MPPDSPSLSRQSWSRYLWTFLSLANVWACGVAMGQARWPQAVAATFFAVVCWWLKDARVSVLLAVANVPQLSTCIRCDGAGSNRGRTCGRCGGDGIEMDLGDD